jgi:hypothetical protein
MRWLGVLVIAACAGLAGCSESAKVNYRVTIEIDDNGVPRADSGVWSTELTENKSVFTPGFDVKFRGEAIAIDFPGRPTLFVLPQGRRLDGTPSGYVEWIKDIYRDKLPLGFRGNNLEIIREISGHKGWTYSFKCSDPLKTRKEELAAARKAECPTFVAFKDINQPGSAISIDPMQMSFFGNGVNVRKITVAVTNDEMTVGLEKRLKWLPEYTDKDLHFNGSQSSGMVSGDFLDNMEPSVMSSEFQK